ncbi:Na(+)/H(+) antiporter NhaA [Tersicoccus solisilvae]|uniref:Na(+)/H(+) antiporter NhaA n=1 Tax=Tersicoccus solisilvae TaxID=1882339 RepID=A0ABQ1PN16_9MICC|nr:Na+/H+ antiporter NhaA [Tersicoccus solisilvae]GGC99899.1 Na(+)/H(+) antiporter NhaA [Tersicoccus solisilvae]
MSRTPATPTTLRTILGRGSRREDRRIGEILRRETVGGMLLLVATALALLWANSPWAAGYTTLRDAHLSLEALHLDLTVGEWAADGLLAIFFFLVGLELKKEFVVGDLRDVSRAVVPVAAAFGGVAVPALIYVLVNASAGPEALRGWAIPTATDIAFALAVLAVIGSHLPSALRTFLLTLAVVDDLIAIVIIALVYTDDLQPGYLLASIVPLALFAVIAQRRERLFRHRPGAAVLLLLPLALVTWFCVHASGVHATIAGVLLGLTVPVRVRTRTPETHGAPRTAVQEGLAETFEHRLRPLSTVVAVPLFAFFSAGVALGGWEGIRATAADPVAVGITVGLVAGKTVGILGTTALLTRTTRARLDPSVGWADLTGIAVLGGIGFTVSLLVAELSFATASPHHDHAKVAILTGSLIAAVLAAVILRVRNRHHRRRAVHRVG